MILYKRNQKGIPIFWQIDIKNNSIVVNYGIVGKTAHFEKINTYRNLNKEVESLIKEKRKQGYKELKDLYDNAPNDLSSSDLIQYLNTYLPKFNTHDDGKFIPMLCKTLEDNKPFEKGSYIGQWKINGERCIITASKSNDLFGDVKLHYRSREGIDWTDKLSYLDKYIISAIKGVILDMMVEEEVALDGELYLPGYKINQINSFIKNIDLPQHYELQYWCYDICIDEMTAIKRQELLMNNLNLTLIHILSKNEHINVNKHFNLIPYVFVPDINIATTLRDKFIDLGFEGLIIRNIKSSYQFGGKRNNSMLKYKKIEDGLFEILDVREDKRGLPVFILKNDINDEIFECTLNATQTIQRFYLGMKNKLKGTLGLVEYRERSGIKQVPFHCKLIKITYDKS